MPAIHDAGKMPAVHTRSEVMRKQFFPYLLANYPSESRFRDVLQQTLAFANAIEIGIPFSDPVADGPVIRQASEQVLASGFQIESVFRALQHAAPRIPVAIMTYANPVLFYGRDSFFHASRDSGARWLIVPDVPFEESAEWKQHAAEAGLQWVSFVSLQTRPDRLRRIAQSAKGFLYLLSLTGITGATIRESELILQKAREIRQHTQVPVAVGFGIKSPADVAPLLNDIDAFIVGSRIVELIRENVPLDRYYREFRAALGGGS
jgi:tryptophan synthase alpha chain